MKHILLALFSASLLAQNIALDSARIAMAAYEKTPQTGFEKRHEHESLLFGNRLMVFYDSTSNTLYMSIRGTDRLQNWIANTHVATIGEEGGVRKILASALDSLIPKKYKKPYNIVKDVLKESNEAWFILAFLNLETQVDLTLKQHPNVQVVFTGHSYGGLMANLLAQKAYHQHKNLKFECHTFSNPGAKEIRKDSLKIPEVPQEILAKHFFNHARITDPIGHTNTHEGNVLKYQPALRKDVLGAHAIGYFVEDLKKGMRPISKAS